MWDEAELGWWYTLGLSQYGLASMETCINESFKNKDVNVV